MLRFSILCVGVRGIEVELHLLLLLLDVCVRGE
jgi:hypothetical protein